MFLCPASVSRVLFRRTLGMEAGLDVWERPQEDVAFSDSPTENRVDGGCEEYEGE